MTDDAGKAHLFPDLSLVEGGPLYRLGVALSLNGFFRPAVALSMLAWLPLFLLSTVAGTLSGGVDVPFLDSYGTHARYLLALPLLFAAEWRADPQFRRLVGHLVSSRLVRPAEMDEFGNIVRSTLRLRDSAIAEAALVAIVIFVAVIGGGFDPSSGLSSWRARGATGEGGLTFAGWWATVVALPMFQFLLGRWIWRVLIWWRFLWRFSRLDLQLVPTHPDRAGGLGYLGVVQGHFDVLCFAVSAVQAGIFAEEILFRGATLLSLWPLIVTLVVSVQVLFVGPTLVFSPRLMVLKRRGLREYGVLGMHYARDFEAKWVHGSTTHEEPFLGSSDIQSLADLAGGFEIIEGLHGVPFGRRLPLGLLIATVVPMLILLPVAYPEEHFLVEGLRLIIGL